MSCCPALPTINGVPGGFAPSGGDASLFGPTTIEIVGAANTIVPLATLPVNGAMAIVRGLAVAAREIAPGTATFGQASFGGSLLAVTNAVDGTIVYGSPPWGPPAVPTMNSTGYLAPLAFGSPGGIPIVVQVTGAQLELSLTGVAGTTVRFTFLGNLWTFDGATRLI